MFGCFRMGWGVSCVDKTLNKSFYKLGKIIGQNPSYFIIIPTLLTIIFATGYQQLHYQIDPEYLFSPENGAGKLERSIVEEFFQTNYTSNFNVGRITRAGRFGRVIITAKDGERNLIRREVFKELRMLDDMIQNATVTYDDDIFTYRDVCAKWENECFQNDILNLDYLMDDIESGQLNLTFPIMFNPVTWDAHAFPVFFGGTQLSADQTIISVPSLQMVYFVAVDTKRQLQKGNEWEEMFLRVVGKAEDSGMFKHIRIARFASRTLDHELERNTRTVVPYFASTFILMIGFSIITCMMGDVVRSKPWIGFLGNLSAIMATVAAFGLACYLRIDFIGLNLAAPFLMISIGIDDTFVMLAAWRRTSTKLSVPDRMAIMMSDAAVSITITSVTDMVSFWIGIMSPFPSVQIFCTYSALAVLFIFVWHITFFAGWMAVTGYCEEKNLHSIFGYKVMPVSVAIKENRSWLYRAFNTGGINRMDPDNPLDNKEHIGMAFFRDKVATIVNNGFMKFIILLIFAVYLAGACYGLTQIEEGLERRKLSKEDSYSVKFFDLEDEFYREFPYRMQVIVTGELNYSDPEVQNKFEQLTLDLESTSYVSNSLYTESWLRTFLSFVERNNDYLNVTIDTEEEFIRVLKENWLFPGNAYSLDVKFNKDGTKIIASRFLIQALNITDTNHEKVMVADLRKLVRDSPLNASIFHPYFVFFDQFELVRPTAIQSMIVGAIIMMLISFIFIPNILCSLWVAFSIVSIELGVAGYMALWDVNLDSISMINLIMCIGYSIDFTAHICYTYMTSESKKSDERVREALYSLGMPIFQGSISTILGTIALLLANSYIFLVFFKMIFLVITFGALHGLFLLPVLLSLFGPVSCNKEPSLDGSIKGENKHQITSIEKAFPHPYSVPHPPLGLSSIFHSKSYLNSPFKTYGIEEKDQGIGTTSGEDSSESSSTQTQRRQAIEDETVRRRYEEGWRRTSQVSGMSQFQPVADLQTPNHSQVWTGRNYSYDDSNDTPPRRFSGNEGDSELMKSGKSSIEEPTFDDSLQYESHRYSHDDRRRSLYEPNSKRRTSDERTPRRKNTPPEGMYRPNPNRYSSQHNLYHSRPSPQRSSSQRSIHELRHMGDIRFP